MIEVVYDRNVPKLTVKGHAGTAPAGEDLVCAAASILVCTLADMERLERIGDHAVRFVKGDSEVSTIPLPGMRSSVLEVYDAVCNGFAILQQHEPGAVKYEVRGV